VGEPIPTTEFSPREMDRLAAVAQKAVEDLYYARAEVSDPRGEPALPTTPGTSAG